MSRIGLIAHRSRETAQQLSQELTTQLQDLGHQVLVEPTGSEDLDLLAVLGGDGTVLHAASRVLSKSTPVLGVNLGGLGFLTDASPTDALSSIERALRGDCVIEDRSTVACRLLRGDNNGDLGEGLNEVSIERHPAGRVLRLSIEVSGRTILKLASDGVVIATPTGTTAYAFSLRAPVLSPELKALCVAAVAPHSLFDRPLVVGPTETVGIRALERTQGVIAIDGNQVAELQEGDLVEAVVGPSMLRLVRVSESNHFERVVKRFGRALTSD